MDVLLPIWNTFLVHPLMSLALFAYWLAHDFGLAIILVTVAIRLAVYPLYRTQIRSQRAMQELGPAMNELKRKYGKDRQRFAEEQMKLYKERGVNPAAGCLPLVLQLPILFALYSALLQLGCGLGKSGGDCPGLAHDEAQSIVGQNVWLIPVVFLVALLGDGFFGSRWLLRARPLVMYSTIAGSVAFAAFVFLVLTTMFANPVAAGGTLDTTANWLPWIIRGLQHPDPFFILPVIAGAAQLIASVMAMPAKPVQTDDPNQKMFQSMAYTFPIMTVVLGAQFPAGLTLYWIATTVFQIVQQYFVSGWGQLPKYLKFLRNIPTPADREMQRETAEIVREGKADLERMGAQTGANGDGDGNGDGAAAGRGQGRRRGRRRGKR